MADEKDRGGRFQIGGKPGPGRPVGIRNKLGQEFLQALKNDWEIGGIKAIETVRLERPQDYLKVIAGLLPKELHVRESALDEMSDDDIANALDILRSVASAGIGAALRTGAKEKAGQKQSGPVRPLN